MTEKLNIIFDLGGVLLKIDYNKTIDSFKSLGVENFDSVYTQVRQSQLFNQFEIGAISNEEFCSRLSKSGNRLSQNQIKKCWNAMLLEFPRENFQALERLNADYNIYLLSNTNDLHLEAFKKLISTKFGWREFKGLFNQTYFSHEIGLRKPTKEIFEHVIRDSNLDITKTIFLDDSRKHVDGGTKAGIKSYLFPQNELLNSVLPGILAKLN